jgi:hypothetical protein
MSSRAARPGRHLDALVTVYPQLRFSGAVERDSAIDGWLDTQENELGSIARTWFTLMRQCGPGVCELMHDGCPTACVEDAPFGYVNAFKAHVNVGFFHGAALTDPAGVLEGTGRFMRHVKLQPGRAFDEPGLEALIAAAYRDIVARLDATAPPSINASKPRKRRE